jgi:predicted ABC-type sugar transport system permease subunit
MSLKVLILGVNGFWQYVATGIVIIVAVLLDQLKTRVAK